MFFIRVVLSLLGFSVFAGPVHADEPVSQAENLCVQGQGGGERVSCDGNPSACQSDEVCVARDSGESYCEVSCWNANSGQPTPESCAIGETCVPLANNAWCKPTHFRMDLNLLDKAISFWIQGLQPAWDNTNSCSIEASLDRLLDQDGNNKFDIFDVDLSILAFLEQPICEECVSSSQPGCSLNGTQYWHCDLESLTGCATSAHCGQGAYCDEERNVCVRECGMIPYSREAQVEGLDRQCVGALKTCDRQRGKCESIPAESVKEVHCEVDQNCPAGAYCFLGKCEPKCYRSIDCPGNRWYCADTNKCRALPQGTAEEGFIFVPEDYVIRFGRSQVGMDPINNVSASEMAIIDLKTRQQVVGNAAVSFGYRLELEYGIKQDLACTLAVGTNCETEPEALGLGTTTAECEEKKRDCIIEPEEEWLQLLSPFGVINGASTPSMDFQLNEAVESLSPGVYPAELMAIFDNGDSHRLSILLTVPLVSGEYVGSLDAYMDDPSAPINGLQALKVEMKMEITDSPAVWNTLLAEQNIQQTGSDIIDLMSGRLVKANLHGNGSLIFTRGDEGTRDENGETIWSGNEIPLVGIYDEESTLLRLIGIIDTPADFSICENASNGLSGACESFLEVKNRFGRNIRRQIEFYGPYDKSMKRYSGAYREKITGLLPGSELTPVGIQGDFILDQLTMDDSTLLWGGAANNSCANPDSDNAGTLVCVNSNQELCAEGTEDCFCEQICRCEVPGKQKIHTASGPVAAGRPFGLEENHVYSECAPDPTNTSRCLMPSEGGSGDEAICVCPLNGLRLLYCGDHPCEASEVPEAVVAWDEISECALDNNFKLLPADEQLDSFPEWGPQLDQVISDFCTDTSSFASEQSYQAYLNDVLSGGDRIFSELLNFEESVEDALVALESGTQQGGNWDRLTVHEFLASWVLPCEETCTTNAQCVTLHGADDALCQNGHCVVHGQLDVHDEDTVACVEEKEALCGMYLYRKALLNQWVSSDAVSGCSGTNACSPRPDWPLYCPETLGIDGCVATLPSTTPSAERTSYEAVFTYQEHSRFWINLIQSIKFRGDKELSDAFMTLYRHQVNPFQQGAALSYKQSKLREAVRQYNHAVDLIFDPISAQVFHSWPMRGFEQMGNDWLDMVQVVLSDRMEAMVQLADLKRRVLLNAGERDFIFAQHALQQDYLLQVYLMAMQKEWQGESFSYLGSAAQTLTQGQELISIFNTNKNELGVTSNVVYFENDNVDLSNWEYYQDQLTGSNGLIDAAEAHFDDVVVEIQNALSDLDSFEGSLLESRIDMETHLIEMCGTTFLLEDPTDDINGDGVVDAQDNVGDLDADGDRDYCDYLLENYNTPEKVIWLAECKFNGTSNRQGFGPCPGGSYVHTCENIGNIRANGALGGNITSDLNNHDCTNLATTFLSAPGGLEGTTNNATNNTDPLNQAPRCVLRDTSGDASLVLSNINGKETACVGGAMGELLQEKASLELEREQLVGDLETLRRELDILHDQLDEIVSLQNGIHTGFNIKTAINTALSTVKDTLDATAGILNASGDIPDCYFQAGFSIGTDCPMHIASAFIKLSARSLYFIPVGLNVAMSTADWIYDSLEMESGNAEENKQMVAEMQAKFREIDDILTQFRLLSQSIFNVGSSIEDLKQEVRQRARLYQTEVNFVVDHLVGRETGSILYGRKMAMEADSKIREIRLIAYKMLRAFVHHYNVSEGQATVLQNQLMASITLDEIKDFVDTLADEALADCGQESIDCDTYSNVEVLRVSLRELLFPTLRDVIDSRTGKVLTAGQQFHNAITGPTYLRRRVVGEMAVQRVELPFSLLLTTLRNSPTGPRWMIDPMSCNHRMVGQSNAYTGGNLAVNLIGQNLDDQDSITNGRFVRYEMIRGSSDFIRSCEPEVTYGELGTISDVQYTIRNHVIGYAPQSLEGQQDAPPLFVTQSAAMKACINAQESNGEIDPASSCWRYFARDRSLSALDWKLMIPIRIQEAATDNHWIMGEGISNAADEPVIEDIILYFRYSNRPVNY